MKYWIVLVGIATSLSTTLASAGDLSVTVVQAYPLMGYKYGPGTELELSNGGDPRPGLLLGRTDSPERGADELIVMDVRKKRILYVDRSLLDSSMRWSSIFPYADPVEQSEGTCAAYAMYNTVRQLDVLRLIDGPKSLEENVRLIGYFINEYYLNPSRRNSIATIMSSVGERMGFKCRKKAFDDRRDLLDAIDARLDEGLPVLIEFEIGSEMVSSTYDLLEYEADEPEKDPRLWLPRRKGQRSGGGHAIVLTSSFRYGRRTKYVALDSDWTDPRVWDAGVALGKDIRMDELNIVDCVPTAR
jgi:hypothetical protein